MKKAFFIGFNKTATSSLHSLFLNSGYKSIHWTDGKGCYALDMYNNLKNKKPILDKIDADCLTDICSVPGYFPHLEGNDLYLDAEFFYKKWYAEYPDSYYILQTRNMKDWIHSRIHHQRGKYLMKFQKYFNMKRKEVVEMWIKQYKDHHKNVKTFFTNKKNFIIFNIDKDPIQKVINFVKDDFKLNNSKWQIYNATLR